MEETNCSKQVKIITIHFGANHGSVLQSYALSTYFDSIGFDAQIIDYVPKRYKVWNALFSRKRGRYLLPVILAYYPIAVLKSMRVRKLFRNFLERNLKLTKRYSNNEELKTMPPEADIYISGSDQVWNNDYNGNDDFSYFLDFIPKQAKRVAYAASFGKEDIFDDEHLNNIKPMLKAFDAISVRESDAKNILNKLEIPFTHVVDPVFLLSKEQWMQFSDTVKNDKPYILVYVMDGDYKELLDYAQKIKERTGNDIYIISFKRIKDERIDKCFYLADPKDFVGLIHNAEVVVTNSFHGTAFSILFKKQFITIGKKKYNSRMLSLLKKLSLTKHFVPHGSDLNEESINSIIQNNDINSIDNILNDWILESKEFIKRNCSCEVISRVK